MVSHAFAHRRKKMRNRLKGVPRKIERVPNWNRERWVEAVNLLLSDEENTVLEEGWQDFRPEELEVEEWLLLAQRLEYFNQQFTE
jgi:16S rRNA A1518/A1519 N6-dimethyltransferase RsmA/KsgA/DIM1 with predicted DNA glycosylase/AP lyase activity